MKLLFLANRIPYPPYRGDKLKIYHLARQLSRQHELHLCTFTERRDDVAYLPELKKYFSDISLVHLPKAVKAANVARGLVKSQPLQVAYFQSRVMQQAVDAMLAKTRFDAVHVQHLRMAPYLASASLPRILDLPDAFSLYWKRRWEASRFAKAGLSKTEHMRLLSYERQMLPRYQRVLTCSAEDKAYLEEVHDFNHIRLLPNGVDLETFYPRNPATTRPNPVLLFTGNMDYAPNVDAVLWFVRDILPAVRQKVPEVVLRIAGQRPVSAVQSLEGDGVVVTGFVEDLAAEYAGADVVVSPLRFGAGTQNKVLEALAMSRPVVCTPVGFAGLGIQDGEGAFMRPDAFSFAAQLVALLQNPALCHETGAAGHARVAAAFGWPAIAEKLEAYFEELVQNEAVG